jgi:hypothetical protein
VSPRPSFEQAFSKIIDHLRAQPEGDAKTQGLVLSLREKVTQEGVTTEAGIELENTLRAPGLVGRMHRRRVETITVHHGAPVDELLQLARALAADEGPIPVTEKVQVSFVVDVTPGELVGLSEPAGQVEDAEISLVIGFDQDDDRAPRMAYGPADELQLLARAIKESERTGSWTEALHAAQALAQLTERTPSDSRRRMAIAGRRMISHSLMRAFIDHAIRTPEERPRVVQVLEWAGREATEVVIDTLSETESIGPKAFLCDLAARLPDAYPMALALLKSPDWYHVRLGADLLTRRREPDAVGALAAQRGHGDPRVRLAVMTALGCLDAPTTVEPLLKGLADPEVAVRVAAAAGLGGRSTRGVTMALAQALELERDPIVRIAMIDALGAIGSYEAATVLATVATTPRTFFRRHGYLMDQRLAAVAALAGCPARSAERALERVAAKGKREVAEVARRALEHHDSEARLGLVSDG